MAFTYSNVPVLSKLKVGNQIYFLKDAEVRSIVDGFNSNIVNGSLGLVTENNKLVYSQNIKSYVDAAVSAIKPFQYQISQEIPEPIAANVGIIFLVPKGQGLTGYREYIVLDLGEQADPRYVTEEIGDTDIDLSDYYDKDEIDALLGAKADVADLGALAYKDSASGTVAGQTISGVKATGSVSASMSGDLGYTATNLASSGSFTPEGSVNGGKVTAAGSISGAIAKDNVNGVEISGTVSAPTVSVVLGTKNVQFVDSVGTLPSKAADTFTAATLGNATKSSFATEGLNAAIDSEDTELLIFSAASTSQAVTEQGAFNGGSFVEGQFSAGSLPTLKDAEAVATGSVTSATASAPIFSGDKYSFSGTFSGSEVNVSGASFSGSAGTVNVSGSYDKATKGTLAVQGDNNVSLDVGDIVVSSKNVTVE